MEKEVRIKVEQDMVSHAKIGVKHGLVNNSSKPIELYCVSIPPPPERGPIGEAIEIARRQLHDEQ
jgi:mannose-6-phosphate isomerase-like protein (cupin superfamily)